MLKLNKELIKQSKEKMYFEKELKRVEYEPLEDNYIAFDMLVEDINHLLDVDDVDFIWYNKNSRNKNILEDKLYNQTSVQLWEKRAKEVYKKVINSIEDKEELEVIKKYKNDVISFLEDFEIGVEIYSNDAGDNDISLSKYEVNYYISSIEKKEDFIFEQNPTTYYNYIDEIIINEIKEFEHDIMEEFEVLEIDVNWYCQGDRDFYVIYFHIDDIPKIEKYHSMSIENWIEQVEKAIWSLFTIQEIWYSEIYNIKYYNENKEFTSEEEEKEFISSIVVYDICEDIEEQIRQAEWYNKDIKIESDF